MASVEWIAVDWGTSNLRVWVLGRGGKVLAELASDQGMGSLTPDVFEPALLDLVAPYLDNNAPVPVICCGMVGARQGWSEAAYSAVPCSPPDAHRALKVAANDPRLDVRILPGLMQKTPADVMRGEETQIAGLLARKPDFDGTLCMPGTHTKWVQISAGEIVSFRTFMTGELFALLSTRSVLRHSVASDGWVDDAFDMAVQDALSSPQHFASRLFGLRAESLLEDMPAAQARARLSGGLIGLELAGAKGYWLGMDVALIGDPALTALYGKALGQQGVPSQDLSGENLTLAGLTAAYLSLTKEHS